MMSDDTTTRAINMPDHIWARVTAHAAARQMSWDSALAELITMGFAVSPAYVRGVTEFSR